MSALDRSPANRNFLSPLNFQFSIKRAPTINFFVQSVSLPGIILPAIPRGNPFVNLPQTGDHIDFQPLSISFKVDENLANYMEIYNWIMALGFPDQFSQYKALADVPEYTGGGIHSEISLLIGTNAKNAHYNVVFSDAFPIQLSGMNFNSTARDVDHISASATFRYRKFEFLTV